jgi:hypothetical protein
MVKDYCHKYYFLKLGVFEFFLGHISSVHSSFGLVAVLYIFIYLLIIIYIIMIIFIFFNLKTCV